MREGHLDVAFAIEALAGSTLVRLELRELALPEAQDVGGDITEFSDFADAESRACPGCRTRRLGWFFGLAGAAPCLGLR